MSIRVIHNIPADMVAAQEQLHRDCGATSVTRQPEPDGEFTLVVVYPDYETFRSMTARITPAAE